MLKIMMIGPLRAYAKDEREITNFHEGFTAQHRVIGLGEPQLGPCSSLG